jgi:hypothetical protein
VRPAVRLQTKATSLDRLALGQSRLGGVPDLPPRFKWPTYRGEPLAFIAEVNLAEVAATAPLDGLPKEGHLWFFYASDQTHWGFDPKDAGSSLVHYESGAPLARRPAPADLPPEGRFAPCALSFTGYVDLPDATDERQPIPDEDEQSSSGYHDVQDFLASDDGTVAHKLLGTRNPSRTGWSSSAPR